MLQRIILIYFVHLFLVEEIGGQSLGSAINTEELVVNNPITNSLTANIIGPNMISANPVQANANMDSMGLPHIIANGPAIIEPIAASLANPGDSDDLLRSARGALIGGFGNPSLSTLGFVGSPVLIGQFAGGIPGMSDSVMLGAGIGSNVQTIGSVTQPVRELIIDRSIPEIFKVPSIPGSVIALPSGANAGGPGNIALPTYTTTTSTINNSPVNIGSISNGPLTNPVLGEFNQLYVPNGLVNPMVSGATVNGLQSSSAIAGVPTGLKGSTLANPTFTNVPNLQGPAKTLPLAFPGNNLAASKQILASLTGIDPASLGAKTRFKVTSASPIAPTGLKIQADNLLMEGKLTVSGKLPFLGSVAVDGVLPDGGKGTVVYECGNGNVGMVNEGPSPTAFGGISTLNSVIPNGLTNVAINPLGLRNNLF